MSIVPQKDIDRFWSHVDRSGECWLWIGSKRGGYGRMYFQGRNHNTNRLAYEWFVAPIPEGLDVLHKCDNPSCVRPDHLFVGTHSDNMRDMGRKGRARLQQHPEQTPFGEQHWMHRHPELIPRGEQNGSAKLTADQVREIRVLYSQGATKRYLARQFSVVPATIRFIVNGITWREV
jgi:hypothetical protein